MEKNCKNLNGIFVMLGLMVLGAMLPVAVARYRSYDRIVSVKGLCERQVCADKAVWPLSYKVSGDDLSALYADIERKNSIICEFLEAGGLGADEISKGVPDISDKYTQEYGDNNRTYRYVASCTVTAITSNVESVLALMESQSSLIKQGIVLNSGWDSTPRFEFEGLNAIKPAMVEEATKNAREVAQKFADDSGSKLGKVKDASQGTFSIENLDGSTPHLKKVRIVTYVSYYLGE